MDRKACILLVEDDAALRESIGKFLQGKGFQVSESSRLADATRQLEGDSFDLVLLDLTLPDGNGLDILERFSRRYPQRIVVLTGTGSVETAVLAMKKGAHDFLQKPLNPELLLSTLQRAMNFLRAREECQSLKREIGDAAGFDKFIYRSSAMAEVLATARRYAATPHAVLISGETGTGKELMAQAIHAASSRRGRPLLSVNCAAIPENLAESELFGYRRGAFTGAVADTPGKFALADHGTIFLDEIGELPLAIQAKLLRVLENGEITPLKSRSPLHVDIRVLAASNKNLEEEVKQKRFRADLYYRIEELKIFIPPLRSRNDDILPLAEHFLKVAALVNERHVAAISPEARPLLREYDWPGNVRELRNTILRICASGPWQKILPEHLPLAILHPQAARGEEAQSDSLAAMEAAYIRRILRQTDGNQSLAAAILGISRSSLYRKLAALRLGKDALD
ncbi:MAG: sigma-54-dependent Fis family transcriptional regulator [Candidatus Aminicenantes bacterium]|nr:sigma-54-dependent Fis family transcriptional regulator [Candidatus Aminicenantes bacterium]